jgi:antitoxin MazE
MQLAKWGNSLAVRIPAEIVKKLGWKEGDELEIEIGRNRIVEMMKVEERAALSVEELLERVHALPDKFPADFKFNRQEANERSPGDHAPRKVIDDAAE